MALSLDVPDGFFEAAGACITTAPVVVRWVSGAEASLPGVEFCSRVGKEQILTFNRPLGWAGRETDAQFALKLQPMSLEQKQAATAASFAAPNATIEPLPAPLVPLQTRCTSSLMESTVYTSCSRPIPYRVERVIQ